MKGVTYTNRGAMLGEGAKTPCVPTGPRRPAPSVSGARPCPGQAPPIAAGSASSAGTGPRPFRLRCGVAPVGAAPPRPHRRRGRVASRAGHPGALVILAP
ncbi:hypothetical protein Acsp04_57300 [Actinomadura sp. NBRC 104425]|nr:hypothetical protein Acsp04_57300 [Actinomadura sp. NBRC 104425]